VQIVEGTEELPTAANWSMKVDPHHTSPVVDRSVGFGNAREARSVVVPGRAERRAPKPGLHLRKLVQEEAAGTAHTVERLGSWAAAEVGVAVAGVLGYRRQGACQD
jgi:hypothetical protein